MLNSAEKYLDIKARMSFFSAKRGETFACITRNTAKVAVLRKIALRKIIVKEKKLLTKKKKQTDEHE